MIHQVDLFAGLTAAGYVLVNTSRSFDELGLGEFVRQFHHDRLLTVAASELALEHLGRPLAERGAAGRIRGPHGEGDAWRRSSAAIRERFGGSIAERNVAAAKAAYGYVRLEEEELARAPAD